MVSDCIFRLRVQPAYRMLAMASLTSTKGIDWLHAQTYGVAAQQIKKSDLLRLPLFANE
ncbi:hypothetical protein D3C72_2412180 [compost metagenome]